MLNIYCIYVGPFLKSSDYFLIGLDLKNVSDLTSVLLECGFTLTKPTLLIAEFVLPFLEQEW